jgi:hypothetical protein
MDDLDAGIRHEDINPPKRLDRMFDAGIDLVLLRHIHADADRRFLARQLLGCRVRGIGIQISDDHPAVCLQIALGDGMTDTAGGAGNEGYFAIKLHNSSSTLNGYATIAVSGPSVRSLSALTPGQRSELPLSLFTSSGICTEAHAQRRGFHAPTFDFTIRSYFRAAPDL